MSDAQPPSENPTPAEGGTYRGPDRRRSVIDTRSAAYTGLERRRGPGRRRNDFVKEADEGEMSPEQFLFLKAIDAYKRVNNRPYPTWTEVLEVIRKLGYRKTLPMELNLTAAEDWTEAADAPAFVKPTSQADDAA
ncbi:hypothetical protein ACERK3_13885 [Phycisphaerales bacterium AB-hyl4]|uniref:Uncharacterized protein n=1 Tax=Natronomicrosphaera hydrolytica TaxID=3242702 RepID=A0ABV4U788_9BACT